MRTPHLTLCLTLLASLAYQPAQAGSWFSCCKGTPSYKPLDEAHALKLVSPAKPIVTNQPRPSTSSGQDVYQPTTTTQKPTRYIAIQSDNNGYLVLSPEY